MTIVDLNTQNGRTFPSGRVTKNLVGGTSAIQCRNFSLGYVELEPNGGQVPWHNQEQEEVYFVLRGEGEMCLGKEVRMIKAGQVVHIPPNQYHQLTNIGDDPLIMLYCYGPAGEVAHWRQELEGSLPEAGVDAPGLPPGAHSQWNGSGKTESHKAVTDADS